jgi:hypothetical protein
LRKLYATITLLLFLPCAAFAARQAENPRARSNPRANGFSLTSVYSDLYSDMTTLVRALVAPRPAPVAPRGYQRRGMGDDAIYSGTTYNSMQGMEIQTKSDYINFLKNSYIGTKEDCSNKYEKYVEFFGHDSTLTGRISPREGGPAHDRLDITCEFLRYAHWCFALGFAYAVRDLNDPMYISSGSRCLTYQEFCQSGRTPDNSRIEEYLSRIIDEIMFYNTNIRDTNRNIVSTVTKTASGTATGWKGYDTDSWVAERLPQAAMIRLLCK